MIPYYRVYETLFNKEEIKILNSSCENFIDRYYNEDNLENHIAYLSDKALNRESYGFALTNDKDYHYCIPVIDNSEDITAIFGKEIMQLLTGNEYSRHLFNIQKYYNNSSPVPQHFDGELMEFNFNNGKLNIIEAIVPKFVAVLILENYTEMGTDLHTRDGKYLGNIKCNPGDLLVFDNQRCYHSVPELKVDNFDNKLVRKTIGWRSLEDTCVYYNANKDLSCEPISKLEAQWLMEEYLVNKWPNIWQELKESGKAAF